MFTAPPDSPCITCYMRVWCPSGSGCRDRRGRPSSRQLSMALLALFYDSKCYGSRPAHAGVVAVTAGDLGPKVKTFLRQGSWAHRTIIKPLPGDEFDADILLHLEEDREWKDNPRAYINALYQAFRRSAIYRDMVEKKNRCVRIHYANDCHVDVVPYLTRGFFENQ